MVCLGFQRDRQGGDAQRRALQRRADRAGDGDPAAHVLAVVDPRNQQVRRAIQDFQHGVLHRLGGRPADGVHLPGLAVDHHLADGDRAIRVARQAAPCAGKLVARRGHVHKAQRR